MEISATPPKEELGAVVDLGSESALLLIARRTGDGLEVLEDHALSTRMASALTSEGSLDAARFERTLEVLATYGRRIELAGVPSSRRRLVATEAARRVLDRAALCREVRARCGLELEVLSPEQEGRLSFMGAAGSAGEGAWVVDVGGGSSEVVACGGRRVISIPVGAVDAAARYTGLDGEPPRGAGGLAAFESVVDRALDSHGVRALAGEHPPIEVVLLGGTGANLVCLEEGLESFDHRLAEGATVTAAQAARWARLLEAMPAEERLELPVEPTRADLLPVAFALVGRLLEGISAPRARVSGRGLRFGAIQALFDGPSAPPARQE
jgi:exopolyphosphatase/guanosine-5'-triphosphate,3'-diphosphate pyrophosphatase